MYFLYPLHLQLVDLERETVKWCRQILRNSPTAIRVLKSALNAVDDGHAGLQVFVRLILRNSNIAILFLLCSPPSDVYVRVSTIVTGICATGARRERNTDLLWD
jgi:hypothetical protein